MMSEQEGYIHNAFISREALELRSPPQACTSIILMDEHGEVGRLSWDEGSLAFSGDMAESAQIFFDNFLKPLVDGYIEAQTVPPNDRKPESLLDYMDQIQIWADEWDQQRPPMSAEEYKALLDELSQ